MFNIKKKYDLIFSLGEACSCTQALRRKFLQINSYPFDWLFGSNFIDRCKILSNNFENFINKEDLEYYHEGPIFNAYYDKHNDITFNHDFIKEIPFDEMYPKVFEKYNRRINRLLNNIEKAEKVLVVYIEMPLTNHIEISDNEILEGYDILKNKFGDKIELLYVKNSSKEKYNTKLAPNITKIVCDYKKQNAELDSMSDRNILEKILKAYKLNLPFYYVPQKNIIRFLIKLIPNKKLKTKMKEKYHV